MSKSSAASASKNVPQLPQKSAWSRGPPQSTSSASTPRSQSPAPNATPPTSASHSRRPSTLGSGVSFKEGVGAARSPTSTVKAGECLFTLLSPHFHLRLFVSLSRLLHTLVFALASLCGASVRLAGRFALLYLRYSELASCFTQLSVSGF